MSLNDLEEACSISINTIYRWDKSSPSIDKIKRVADFFGVSVDYLIDRKTDNNDVEAYLQQMHDDPSLRALLSASKGVSSDDLKLVIKMLERMKGEI